MPQLLKLEATVTDPVYQYMDDSTIMVTCIVNIAPPGKTTPVRSIPMTYHVDPQIANYKELMTANFAAQAQIEVDKVKAITSKVDLAFGTQDFAVAMGTVMSDVVTRLVL